MHIKFRRMLQNGCETGSPACRGGAASPRQTIRVMGFGQRKEWELDDEIDEVLPVDETLYQADFSYGEFDEDDEDDSVEFPPLDDLDDFDGDELV